LCRIRSGYAENRRSIPEKHGQSFIKQLGSPDIRLAAVGLVPSPDIAIQIIRRAKQEAPEFRSVNNVRDLLARNLSSGASFGEMAKIFSELMDGMALFDDEVHGRSRSRRMDTIEELILNAPREAYSEARELFWQLVQNGMEMVTGMMAPTTTSEARLVAKNSIVNSMLWDPKWTATTFTVCLARAVRVRAARSTNGL
jgi:hypothetical protein